jgi:hypothetical protein
VERNTEAEGDKVKEVEVVGGGGIWGTTREIMEQCQHVSQRIGNVLVCGSHTDLHYKKKCAVDSKQLNCERR